MYIVNCESDKHIVNGVIVFGLFRPIMNYSEEQANRMGLEHHCNLIDQNGDVYKLYCDYDVCLQISCAVAVPLTNAEVKSWISEYLNDGWISESEYITLYNDIAYRIGEKPLTDPKEIYTEENKQEQIIEFIMRNKNMYKRIFECM